MEDIKLIENMINHLRTLKSDIQKKEKLSTKLRDTQLCDVSPKRIEKMSEKAVEKYLDLLDKSDAKKDNSFKGVKPGKSTFKEIEESVGTRLNPNDLAFWLPEIKKNTSDSEYKMLGIPKTITLKIPDIAFEYIYNGPNFSRKEAVSEYNKLIKGIHDYVVSEVTYPNIGYPIFIKTGTTAFKWLWDTTCYIENKEFLSKNVRNLFYESFLVGARPTKSLVIREFVETDILFHAFDGKMPIKQEYRVFINDGKFDKLYWYWTDKAFEKESDYENIKKILKENKQLSGHEFNSMMELVKILSKVFSEGSWSLDFMLDKNNNWRFIDMAVGDDSWRDESELMMEGEG